ncbi:hypothetical protein [Sphaerisporangium sp. TRM90804]|uniref:hypothetical protein n=1 Tax=Sphaerisporangium sp. TRM90804 TaxID=3031113 RepID=UPI00244A21A8|nr:hypothetical protein [Sphaerisporangium sp. TRM90804]MDH2425435.1 hypothetical protein [Sphaerisporangium sp. TRM90804]
MSEYPANYGSTGAPTPQGGQDTTQRAKEAAGEVAGTAKQAAGQVAGTAKQQAGAVAGEVKTQAGQAIGQLRSRASKEADSQAQRAAQGIRQWADDLSYMAENSKPDSPMRTATHHVAETGKRAADYLEEHGVAGVAQDVQRFARKRPGVFLAGALAAGFLVGRLAKAGMSADEPDEGRASRDGRQDYDRLQTTYPAPTGYGYATPQPEPYTSGPEPYADPQAPYTSPQTPYTSQQTPYTSQEAPYTSPDQVEYTGGTGYTEYPSAAPQPGAPTPGQARPYGEEPSAAPGEERR